MIIAKRWMIFPTSFISLFLKNKPVLWGGANPLQDSIDILSDTFVGAFEIPFSFNSFVQSGTSVILWQDEYAIDLPDLILATGRP